MAEPESRNGSESISESADGESTLCIQCQLPIPKAANKCTKCDSYQRGLRRYLGVSQTVLALLVALVSVLGWAIPTLHDALKERKTDLNAGFVGSELRWSTATDSDRLIYELRVMINNSGDRPGIVDSEATLNVKPRGKLRQTEFTMEAEDGPFLLEAHESTYIKMKGPMSGIKSAGSFKKSTLTLKIVNFDSSKEEIDVAIPGDNWGSPP